MEMVPCLQTQGPLIVGLAPSLCILCAGQSSCHLHKSLHAFPLMKQTHRARVVHCPFQINGLARGRKERGTEASARHSTWHAIGPHLRGRMGQAHRRVAQWSQGRHLPVSTPVSISASGSRKRMKGKPLGLGSVFALLSGIGSCISQPTQMGPPSTGASRGRAVPFPLKPALGSGGTLRECPWNRAEHLSCCVVVYSPVKWHWLI